MSKIDPNNVKFVERDNPSSDRNKNINKGGVGSEDNVPTFDNFKVSKAEDTSYKGFLTRFALQNPFVPIGAFATLTALIFGVRAMSRGDRIQQQLMMRYRVGFQFFTIAALIAGMAITGDSWKPRGDDD